MSIAILCAFVKRRSKAGRKKLPHAQCFRALGPVASQVPEQAVAQDDGGVGCVDGLARPGLLQTRAEYALGSIFDAAGANM